MISLRQPHAEDLAFINKWQQDPFIITWYNSGSPMRLANSIDDYLPHPESEHFVIENDDQPIGMMHVENYTSQTVSIVYYIGEKQARGQGLGVQIIGQLLKIAKQRNWQTIHAGVCLLNYPSWNILLESGFKVLGIQKDDTQFTVFPGQAFDSLRLTYSPRFASYEERIHQLISSTVLEQKPEILEKYRKINE